MSGSRHEIRVCVLWDTPPRVGPFLSGLKTGLNQRSGRLIESGFPLTLASKTGSWHCVIYAHPLQGVSRVCKCRGRGQDSISGNLCHQESILSSGDSAVEARLAKGDQFDGIWNTNWKLDLNNGRAGSSWSQGLPFSS